MGEEKCSTCGSGEIVRGIHVGKQAESGNIGLDYQTVLIVTGTEPLLAGLCASCGTVACGCRILTGSGGSPANSGSYQPADVVNSLIGKCETTMSRDIDQIIEQVRQRFPTVESWQLRVTHPGVDDDGIWFFTLPNAEMGYRRKDIQIESSDGSCPFIVEHSDMASTSEAETARWVDEAVEKVCLYLTSLQNRTR